jgi:biotin operon repressor
MTEETRACPTLRFDPEGFDRMQRLAMYEIASAMLDLASDVHRTLGLRPDACQVYMLIAVSAVQRYARAPEAAHVGADPLPAERIGTISRRRLADASGLPRETVARHVRNLIERGLVIERGRGQLTTPPGLLRDLAPTGLLDRLARRSAALANALARLEVLVPAERRD